MKGTSFAAAIGAVAGHFILNAVSHVQLKATTPYGSSDHMLVSDDPKMYFYGLGFALIVGLAASLIPALRGARVEPVDVLRGMVS